MNITTEQTLAIATLVITSTQLVKRITPGDYDAYGPLIALVISIVASLAWVKQYNPDALLLSPFDIMTLVMGVYTTAAGGYTVARQVTAVGGRSVEKLRAVRDTKRDDTVTEQAA